MYLLERVARSLFRPPKCPCLMVRPSAADVVLYKLGREPNCGLPTSMECDLQNCVNIENSLLTRNFVCEKVGTYLTGALASDGVVEGAVEEAGVRIVRWGATPCLAHRILCLWPEIEEDQSNGWV